MSDEEILDVRPRRLPRWAVGLASLLVAALAVWGVTRLASGGEKKPVPAAASSAAPETSEPPRAAGPFDVHSLRDQLLAYVYDRTHDPEPSANIVRAGGSNSSCAVPPAGLSPPDRIRELVRAAFPSYALIDVARVFDRFAGICVLDLRAREPRGTALLMHVVSPIEDAAVVSPRLDAGEAVVDGMRTQFVRVSTHDGWVITVGTSGPPGTAPDREALTMLAEQPDARW